MNFKLYLERNFEMNIVDHSLAKAHNLGLSYYFFNEPSFDSVLIAEKGLVLNIKSEATSILYASITNYHYTRLDLDRIMQLKKNPGEQKIELIRYTIETNENQFDLRINFEFGLLFEPMIATLQRLKSNYLKGSGNDFESFKKFCETCGLPKPAWSENKCRHCGGILTNRKSL